MKKKYIKFYVLFTIVLLIAILTPHIVHGHVLLPEKYAQSAVLLLDLVIALIFYYVYRKDVDNLNNEKNKIKNDLDDSYKYIGQNNRKLDILNYFINQPHNISRKQKKEIFNLLLENILVSIIKADKGMIRFINQQNYKTIKEFYYHKDGDQFITKISNKDLISLKETEATINEVNVVKSSSSTLDTACVLSYKTTEKEKIDMKLIQSLINQMHLLFSAVYAAK